MTDLGISRSSGPHAHGGPESYLSPQDPGRPQNESQAAEDGKSMYTSAILESQCESVARRMFASGNTHAAANEQVHDRPKRATSPAGSSGEEGPPNTPHNENEAAGALNDAAEHATELDALLSALEVAGQCPLDEGSEKGNALSDTEHSTNPASPTTPPKEYKDIDEEDEFEVRNGM